MSDDWPCSDLCSRLHLEDILFRMPHGSITFHQLVMSYFRANDPDVHSVRQVTPSSHIVNSQFSSCRGLKVLVDLLDEDFVEQRDLVVHAIDGIGNVFDLQSPTPKNDFCRMFIREGLLNPLSSALINVMAADSETSAAMKSKIIQIILVFCQVSQSDIHVRNALGTRMVVRRKWISSMLAFPEYSILI